MGGGASTANNNGRRQKLKAHAYAVGRAAAHSSTLADVAEDERQEAKLSHVAPTRDTKLADGRRSRMAPNKARKQEAATSHKSTYHSATQATSRTLMHADTPGMAWRSRPVIRPRRWATSRSGNGRAATHTRRF